MRGKLCRYRAKPIFREAVNICPHLFLAVLRSQRYHLSRRAISQLQQVSAVHIGESLCALPGGGCHLFNLFISNIGVIFTARFRGKGEITALRCGIQNQIQHLFCPNGIRQTVLHICRISGLQIPAGLKIRCHIKAHWQCIVILIQPDTILLSKRCPHRGILWLLRIKTVFYRKQRVYERRTACNTVSVRGALTAQLLKECRQIRIRSG